LIAYARSRKDGSSQALLHAPSGKEGV
jgi:hypothetical protein